jgi:predicted protein tyrosine phosphatase
MIEVHSNLFIGDQKDYERVVAGEEGWAIVHACKEPYHRRALGYRGRGAPKNHPEYLVARRGHRLILNIVDASNPDFFDKGMIYEALDFIDEALSQNQRVLIHCNQGESRGPAIGLLYMAARLKALPTDSLEAAESAFRSLYPRYNPKKGIRGHLEQYWQQYCSEVTSSRL